MKKSQPSKQVPVEKKVPPPLTHEELKQRVIPQVVKIFKEPQPSVRDGNTGLCSASTWDSHKVSEWAKANGLHEVARVVSHHDIKGGQLLRTDALTLQRLGVCSGREALLAEEYISGLVVNSVDHDASDDTGFPVEMHKSIYRGEAACPGYSPLDLLASDPWVDSRLRFLDTDDHCTLRWMGLHHR
ncbi:hypothetical protein ElyMa_006333000 [Elysia marginata]|uniref:SAM domain-containing protein n=1 Tax=Elysia marginata TaxID=1093978 RepID=A0AAV4HIT2_9GAST|nr:hypothetical protein ElyMa_006333000 [Elysia marginata]